MNRDHPVFSFTHLSPRGLSTKTKTRHHVSGTSNTVQPGQFVQLEASILEFYWSVFFKAFSVCRHKAGDEPRQECFLINAECLNRADEIGENTVAACLSAAAAAANGGGRVCRGACHGDDPSDTTTLRRLQRLTECDGSEEEKRPSGSSQTSFCSHGCHLQVLLLIPFNIAYSV